LSNFLEWGIPLTNTTSCFVNQQCCGYASSCNCNTIQFFGNPLIQSLANGSFSYNLTLTNSATVTNVTVSITYPNGTVSSTIIPNLTPCTTEIETLSGLTVGTYTVNVYDNESDPEGLLLGNLSVTIACPTNICLDQKIRFNCCTSYKASMPLNIGNAASQFGYTQPTFGDVVLRPGSTTGNYFVKYTPYDKCPRPDRFTYTTYTVDPATGELISNTSTAILSYNPNKCENKCGDKCDKKNCCKKRSKKCSSSSSSSSSCPKKRNGKKRKLY